MELAVAISKKAQLPLDHFEAVGVVVTAKLSTAPGLRGVTTWVPSAT